MPVNLNKGQEKALKALLSGKNVFITGDPGTGKSFLVREFLSQMEANGKNCLVCAPTGIAAVNVGGVTIHKALHIPVPAWDKKQKINPADSNLRALHIADVVVIDEISMCRNDVFEYAIKTIKAVEKYMSKTIQIVVVGDFYQLPPVVAKADVPLLEKNGFDKSGFSFTSSMWKKCKFKTFELTEPMRQKDVEFVTMLNQARKAIRSCYTYFQNHVIEEDAVPRDCVHIYPTNAKANAYNMEKLSELPGMGCTYFASVKGKVSGEKPVEDTLTLKPGCRVMMLVNSYDGTYYNGTMGTVLECLSNSVQIQTDAGDIIQIEPYTWQFCAYKTEKGKIVKDVYGELSQMPLRLAYAITVHKSQGQTFDRAVIDPSSFADGQFYVAVSRLSNPDGMYFSDDVLPEYIRTNDVVQKFYENFTYVTMTKSKTQAKKSATKTAKPKATKKTSTPVRTKTTTQRKSSTKTTRAKKKTTTKTNSRRPKTNGQR